MGTQTFYSTSYHNNMRAKLVLSWTEPTLGQTSLDVTAQLYFQRNATLSTVIDESHIRYWYPSYTQVLDSANQTISSGTGEVLLQTLTHTFAISQTASTLIQFGGGYYTTTDIYGIDVVGNITIAPTGVPNAHPTAITAGAYNFAKTGGTTNTLAYTVTGGYNWGVVSATITAPTITTTSCSFTISGQNIYVKLTDAQINQLITKWDTDGYITNPVVTIVTSSTGLSNQNWTGLTHILPTITAAYTLNTFTASRGSETGGATPINFSVVVNAASNSPYVQAGAWPAAAALPVKFYKGTTLETGTVTITGISNTSRTYTAASTTTLASNSSQEYSASIVVSSVKYSTQTRVVDILQTFLSFRKDTTNTGKVGINLSGEPTEALDIQGNIKVSGNLSLGGSLTGTGILDMVYPIGSVYISVTSTSPSTLFGGTWAAFGTGKTLVGIDSGQTEFNTVEKTGGTKTHTLSTAEMPSHTHGERSLVGSINDLASQSSSVGLGGAGICTGYQAGTAYGYGTSVSGTRNDSITISATHTHDSAGSGSAHNNLQPYITVYMWKRTA